MAIASSSSAAELEPRITLRPLTPQEIKDYALTGIQGASGLSTIGLGQPAYLEALVNSAVPATDIVSVSWAITTQPVGSVAALKDSPLGSSVPTYKMSDRESSQVAGRTVLSPDLPGQYTVTATITTTGGTTNVSQAITAGTYLGVGTCALCHSGGQIAENKVTPWSQTAHATFFTRAIDGLESDHYGKNCISCHTVGYDANTNAVNGGFDDVAKDLNWTFPAVLTNGNWAAMPAALTNLANIQCENCHGPGSQHAFALGDTSKISVSFAAGDCAQCHDSKPNHVRSAEWNNSGHAVAPVEEEAGCVRCHSANGFANYTAGKPAVADPNWEAITCAACHDPHDATNPHQLRTAAPVKLMDNKTTITEGGAGLLCMNCHMSRRDATNYVEITAGSNRFGPHHGPQADMLAGANAVNYGQVIPSSAHRDVVEDSCATCHMQSVASTNPAFTKVGGHTFKNHLDSDGTNPAVDLTAACSSCHGEIEEFNFPRQDYDGNGVVEGVQTEVRGLLSKLAYMLPPIGVEKTNHSPTNISIDKTWTKPQLKAGYNYLFVVEDGSYGVHNLAYAVGLLKASIADLTGDANSDGLPDSWQVQYFGSANDPKAAPNASPAGDGIPNWLKYSLGLDPTISGATLPDGVVWANGKNLVNPPIDPGNTNSLAIYTAAEVVFNSEIGKNYQIQSVSSLSDGWKNVGDPIAGTGSSISYVTPTRTKVQQFYRVVTIQ
jgi:hypothetical protein